MLSANSKSAKSPSIKTETEGETSSSPQISSDGFDDYFLDLNKAFRKPTGEERRNGSDQFYTVSRNK